MVPFRCRKDIDSLTGFSSSSTIKFSKLLREGRRWIARETSSSSDASSLPAAETSLAKSSSDSSRLIWTTACTRRISVVWEVAFCGSRRCEPLEIAMFGSLPLFFCLDELGIRCRSPIGGCGLSSDEFTRGMSLRRFRGILWFICQALSGRGEACVQDPVYELTCSVRSSSIRDDCAHRSCSTRRKCFCQFRDWSFNWFTSRRSWTIASLCNSVWWAIYGD